MRKLAHLAAAAIGAAALAIFVSPVAANASTSTPAATYATAHLVQSANHQYARVQLRPDSATGCVGINPWNYVETCIHINGSGSYVNWMQGTGCTHAQPVGNPTLNGHEQLTGPGFSRNGSEGLAGDGGCFPDVTWYPYRNVNPGQYCVTTWERVSSTNWKNDGRACATVS